MIVPIVECSDHNEVYCYIDIEEPKIKPMQEEIYKFKAKAEDGWQLEDLLEYLKEIGFDFDVYGNYRRIIEV